MKRNFLKFKKRMQENQYVIPGMIFLLILSVIFYFYHNIKIPRVVADTEAKIRYEIDINAMPKTLMAIVQDPAGISKYTELTEEIIQEKIEFVEIPDKYAILHGVHSAAELVGMVPKQDLRYGEQISQFSLSKASDWYGRYDRLKEYTVKTAVADQVQKGNLVDVIIHYGNGDYDVMLSKVEVVDILRGTTSGNQPDETNPWNLYRDNEYLAVFAVDEMDYRNMKLAENMAAVISMLYQDQVRGPEEFNGYFELRLYIDEDQYESTITFDYEKRLAQLNDILKKLESEALKEAQHIIQDTDMTYIDETRQVELHTPYFEELHQSDDIQQEDYVDFIQNYGSENSEG